MVMISRKSDDRRKKQKEGELVVRVMNEVLSGEDGLFLEQKKFDEGKYCDVYVNKAPRSFFLGILVRSDKKVVISLGDYPCGGIGVRVHDPLYEPIAVRFAEKCEALPIDSYIRAYIRVED